MRDHIEKTRSVTLSGTSSFMTGLLILAAALVPIAPSFADPPPQIDVTNPANSSDVILDRLPAHAGAVTHRVEAPRTLRIDTSTGVSTWVSDDPSLADRQDPVGRGAATPVYANDTTELAAYVIPGVTTGVVFGDWVNLIEPGRVDACQITVYNDPGSPGALLTATVRVSFYDANDWPTFPVGYPATLLGSFDYDVDFGAGLSPSATTIVALTDLVASGTDIYLPTNIVVVQQIVSFTGDVTGIGIAFYDPPSIGYSDGSSWFVAAEGIGIPSGLYGALSGLYGNLGYRIGLEPPGGDVLHDQSDFVVGGPVFTDYWGLASGIPGLSDVTVDGDGWNIERITSYYALDHPEWGGSVTGGYVSVFQKTGPLPLWPDHNPHDSPLVPMSASNAGDHWVVTASALDIDLAPGEYWIGITPISVYSPDRRLSSGTFLGHATATWHEGFGTPPFGEPPYWYNEHPGVDAAMLIRGTRLCTSPHIEVDTTYFNFDLNFNDAIAFQLPISNENGCSTLDYEVTGSCPIGTASGSIPAGEVGGPWLVIDPFGYAPGSYTCWLQVDSNDPYTPLVLVQVDFTLNGTISDAVPGVLYATQGTGGISQWVEIDPLTGAGTVSGSTGRLPDDLTVDGDGRLWAAYTGYIYRVDSASGAMVRLGLTGMETLASHEGFLYGLDVANQVWQFNLDTYEQLGPLATVTPHMDGCAIDPTTGIMYLTPSGAGPGSDTLYMLDLPGLGDEAVAVGPLGYGEPIGDIAFDGQGNLFGVIGGAGPTTLVTIDKTTGLADDIGVVGVDHLSGLAMIGSGLLSAPSDEVSSPTAASFRAASPNPFRGGTSLSFGLPEAGPVRLVIFDATGREVRTLVDGTYPAAAHRVVWDGRDLSGRTVAPGIYFARIRAGEYESVQRLTLIR